MSEGSKELQRLGLLGQTLGSSNLTLEYREGVKLQGIAVREGSKEFTKTSFGGYKVRFRVANDATDGADSALVQTLGAPNLSTEYREGVKLQGIAVRLRGQKSLQRLNLVATRSEALGKRCPPMGLIVHESKHLGPLI